GLLGDVFFKMVFLTEFAIFSRINPKIKKLKMSVDVGKYLGDQRHVVISPIFSTSGLIVRYSKSDVEKIQALELDLLVRGNTLGIFKGDILTASKHGLISFHHGDNSWNRGSSPGFWEVFHSKPSTGFIIQILNEELDGGDVIYRGRLATKRTYVENLSTLYEESSPYLANVIVDFTNTGQLPAYEKKFPFDNKLIKKPSLIQSIGYTWKLMKFVSGKFYNKKLLRKEDRWSVAFHNNSWQNSSLRKGTIISNPHRRFFADPFIIKRDGETICFVEDYSYDDKIACISAIRINDDGSYALLGEVIKEPFHMSFPYVFDYNDELYMIPETKDAGAIRLYQCVDFPLKWEYKKDLMGNVNCVDSMVFEENGWWLLTNKSEQGSSDNGSRLYAYHTDDPINGAWIPHKGNPIVFDSNISRNGGLLSDENNALFRVRQKQSFNEYGKSITIAKIDTLNKSEFSESQVASIDPLFFPNITRCHHIHSNGEYTVYDFLRGERV
ncbi:MAG: hypothetical protein RPR97_19355, partial [Colwellia sp.]